MTPLLVYVLGNLARELISDACKDYLKYHLKSFFGWLGKLGGRDKLELAYQVAMERAYGSCLEMLLLNIKRFGYADEELKEYASSLKAFIKDSEVAQELLNAIRETDRADLPSPDVLRDRWKAVGGQELPSEALWNDVAIAFRRQATKQMILSDDLRELLNAHNLQESAQNLRQIKQLIERTTGVVVEVQQDKYFQRMQTKFSPVDLANLMPAYADDPGRMVIRDVFVAQDVRENPPPVEIPKDLAERLKKGGRRKPGPDTDEDLDEKQLEKLGTAYVSQFPKPVLEVIAATGNRLLVLTGVPGSGKTTLMRYLLTGIIEPPMDRESGEPLPWTPAFKDAFPLLIELRDFYAMRKSGKCDSFLEYVAYMGKTDKWFLDDQAAHGYLEGGQSLVMFDGLDEIFETADRERVMQEIAGFAQRYPRARIIVTSRPVGYKEKVLRDADFAHFGLQDLSDGQIETFIRGWFALTFPQQPQQADQRIERVLTSVRQSKPIRLLAGNPMLLTIMALLAREQELPRERAKFYEKAMEVFCHHWSANQGLDLPGVEWLNVDDKLELLQRIALRMQTGPGGLAANVIHEDDLEDEIKQWFMDRFKLPEHEAIKAARTMIEQLRERNYILCLRGSRLYGFLHRTFLEYLTAAEYVRRFDKQPQQMTIEELVALFDNHCRDEEWREVLRLICGQIDEQFVGQIVEHLATRTDLENWNCETPLPELPLAVHCISEVRNPGHLEAAGQEVLKSVIVVSGRITSSQPISSYLSEDLLPACRELGARWPGRQQLEKVALSHAANLRSFAAGSFWPRFVAHVTTNRDAVQHLATSMKTGQLPQYCRAGALWALTEKWPDETTRKLLEERAVQDEKHQPRSASLEALAEKWPDETTRKLLEERAVQDEHYSPRGAALQALVEHWPDETTRKLLEERAVQDEHYSPRGAALQALVEHWPDETTRELLAERAVQDEQTDPRSAALEALAEKWPVETTRKLLAERTVQDKSEEPRRAALQALAEKWPDETTRKLLAERATVDGVAAWVFGGQHSEFARCVFRKYLAAYGGFLDPRRAISRKHIKWAAEEAGVPADEIDETVRSLSAHMGWDITKGSAG